MLLWTFDGISLLGRQSYAGSASHSEAMTVAVEVHGGEPPGNHSAQSVEVHRERQDR